MLKKLMNSAAINQPVATRRSFLLGTAALGTGLAVGFRPLSAVASSASQGEAAINPLQAYIKIDEDNTITIMCAHLDMGQGAYHGAASLVCEELGVDPETVKVEGGSGNPKLYGNVMWGGTIQGTGGSTGMASSWMRYREAGAMARTMLVKAAAQEWSVPESEIVVDDGVVSHSGGKSSTFGPLAKKAAEITPPSEVTLKTSDEWKIIANEDVKRFDRRAKANGTQDFTIDVMLPGMLTAVPIHPPKFGATLVSFNADEAMKIKGVEAVVETPRGLAVIAKNTWAAIKGREEVTVEWDETKAETRGSAEIMEEYLALANQTPVASARKDGDVPGAMESAAKTLEATYEFPFLAHAALEPLNAVAHRDESGKLRVYGGHQMPDIYQGAAAQVAGMDPSQVEMVVMKTGGGFGRRAVIDADVIVEAVAAAKAIDWRAPVKMQWTREDDMAGGRYRPAYVHKLKAGLDENGDIIAWDNHIVGQSIIKGTPFEGGYIKNGVDITSVEGANNLPYSIPNMDVGLTTTDVTIPVLWWRAVGSTHTAYATEVFFEELVREAGKDSVQARLNLLKDKPRHSAVLNLVAEKAGWNGVDAGNGRFRGVSVHESFGSVVAQIAEVSMEDGSLRVHKVWCAVDCGIAVNPDTVKAQMEGGLGFGLGSILGEELIIEDGEVQDLNYDTYSPLRIEQMPEVEVHILASTNAPSGVGEPGTPPIGPAIANAVFAATGKPVRQLPFSKGLGA